MIKINKECGYFGSNNNIDSTIYLLNYEETLGFVIDNEINEINRIGYNVEYNDGLPFIIEGLINTIQYTDSFDSSTNLHNYTLTLQIQNTKENRVILSELDNLKLYVIFKYNNDLYYRLFGYKFGATIQYNTIEESNIIEIVLSYSDTENNILFITNKNIFQNFRDVIYDSPYNSFLPLYNESSSCLNSDGLAVYNLIGIHNTFNQPLNNEYKVIYDGIENKQMWVRKYNNYSGEIDEEKYFNIGVFYNYSIINGISVKYINTTLCPNEFDTTPQLNFIKGYCAKTDTLPSGLQNNTGIYIEEYEDINPYSPTYGKISYVENNNITLCPINNSNPNWITTGNYNCVVNEWYLNEGGLIDKEEKDNNPYSLSYNQTRFNRTIDTTLCPSETSNINIVISNSFENYILPIITDNGIINWGDGNVETITTQMNGVPHRYFENGTYNISFTSTNYDFRLIDNNNDTKITSINSLGYYNSVNFKNLTSCTYFNPFKITENTSGNVLFNNCQRLTTNPYFEAINITIGSQMFDNCPFLKTITGNQFNTSNMTNMNFMFRDCGNLTTIDYLDFNSITTDNSVIDMFKNCNKLININNIFNIKKSLTLNDCTLLSTITLLNIINALEIIEQDSETLNIGSVNLNKLLDEEKEIATNKGWLLI